MNRRDSLARAATLPFAAAPRRPGGRRNDVPARWSGLDVFGVEMAIRVYPIAAWDALPASAPSPVLGSSAGPRHALDFLTSESPDAPIPGRDDFRPFRLSGIRA